MVNRINRQWSTPNCDANKPDYASQICHGILFKTSILPNGQPVVRGAGGTGPSATGSLTKVEMSTSVLVAI